MSKHPYRLEIHEQSGRVTNVRMTNKARALKLAREEAEWESCQKVILYKNNVEIFSRNGFFA